MLKFCFLSPTRIFIEEPELRLNKHITNPYHIFSWKKKKWEPESVNPPLSFQLGHKCQLFYLNRNRGPVSCLYGSQVRWETREKRRLFQKLQCWVYLEFSKSSNCWTSNFVLSKGSCWRVKPHPIPQQGFDDMWCEQKSFYTISFLKWSRENTKAGKRESLSERGNDELFQLSKIIEMHPA